eukprot:ANDGO_04323.mRNA.1 TPR repeat-containing protein C19B12.01
MFRGLVQSNLCNYVESADAVLGCVSENLRTLASLVLSAADGGSLSVLTSTDPVIAQLLSASHAADTADISECLDYGIRNMIKKTEDVQEFELAVLAILSASLNLFVQIDCVGPPLEDFVVLDSIFRGTAKSFSVLDPEMNAKFAVALSRAGGGAAAVDKHVANLFLMFIGVAIVHHPLVAAAFQTPELKIAFEWWAARTVAMHQHLMEERTDVMFARVQRSFESVIDGARVLSFDLKLQALMRLEYALCLIDYEYAGFASATEQLFAQGWKLSGLQMKLTGAKGRRTKFQTFDTAQLLLATKVVEPAPVDDVVESVRIGEVDKNTNKPLDLDAILEDLRRMPSADGTKVSVNSAAPVSMAIPLQDDVLLESVALNQDLLDVPVEELNGPLDPIHLGFLHAEVLQTLLRETDDEQRREKILAIIERCLRSPGSCFAVFRGILVQRSLLDMEKSRKVERGIMQLDALYEEMASFTRRTHGGHVPAEPAAERLRFVYAASPMHLMNSVDMARLLGKSYLKIGAAATALSHFDNLKMWEDALTCLVVCGRTEEAQQRIEEMTRRDAKLLSDPKILTWMGDLTGDLRWYDEASNSFGRPYARAVRAKAHIYVKKGMNEDACREFEVALKINSMFPASWFAYGCASLACGDYQTSRYAFLRTVQLVPDDAEAWSNLSVALHKLGERKQALSALSHALRSKHDNWKMWSNYMLIAAEDGDFKGIVQSLRRLHEIRPREVELEMLQKVSNIAIRIAQQNAQTCEAFAEFRPDWVLQVVNQLFVQITSHVSDLLAVWTLWSQFMRMVGESPLASTFDRPLQKSVEYAVTAVNVASCPGFESAPPMLKRVFETARGYLLSVFAACQHDANPVEEFKKAKLKARLFLRPLMMRAQRNISESPEYHDFEALVSRIDTLEQGI